jgi:hypothetical protein
MKAWFLSVSPLPMALIAVSPCGVLDLHHSPNTIGSFFGRFETLSS